MELCGSIPGRVGVFRVSINGDRIAAVSPASEGTANDLFIIPGLVDIQVNGYGGVSLGGSDVTPDALRYVVGALRAAGVLFHCPTLTTASHEDFLHALRAITTARRDPAVAHATPCVHLEGPYISPEDGPRGAHALEHVRPPDWEEFQRLQDAADGRIGIVTLAPEAPGALPFIERLASAGVVPALGHTGAAPAQIADAVSAGARLSTHLGNGAHAKIDRHPNYIWEQLADDRLSASIIADGHHLPPAVLKCMARSKGVERTILVSDALAAAGLHPGVYAQSGKQIEVLPTGRIQLYGTPYLAGSGMVLPQGIENMVRYAGVSLADATRMATHNPARLLGLADDIGAVEPGKEASLTLLRWDAETCSATVTGVVTRGALITAEAMADAMRPAGMQVW